MAGLGRRMGLALLTTALVASSGCLQGPPEPDGRLESLERQVAALAAALNAIVQAHLQFGNESSAEAGTLVEMLATVARLQDDHARIESNHTEAQRHTEAIEHFLKELRGAPADPAEVAMAQRVAEAARPSVVRVQVEVEGGSRATGTGWAWGPDLVVTAAHAVSVRLVPRITVQTFDGRSLEATVLNTSAGQDVALLHVPGLALDPLPTGDGAAPGEAVVAIGHPSGYSPWAVSLGHVSRLTEGERPRLQSSAPIAGGSSGGPLLDADGRVVGMTVGGFGSSAEGPSPPRGAHPRPRHAADDRHRVRRPRPRRPHGNPPRRMDGRREVRAGHGHTLGPADLRRAEGRSRHDQSRYCGGHDVVAPVANLTWWDVVIIGVVGMLGFTLLSYWFSGVMTRRNWSWQVKPRAKKPSDAAIQPGSQKPAE